MHKHAPLKTTPLQEQDSENYIPCPASVLWLACFCVPPVAIYLKLGVQKRLCTNMLLTLLWFPGIVHAACVLKAAQKDGQASTKATSE